MKKLFISWLLALLGGAVTVQAQSDGHVLGSLWDEYYAAQKADRPQKEAEVLTRIKKEAMARHLSADFYDAATAYVSSVSRRDWKQTESLEAALKAEVERFDEPIVTFLWMMGPAHLGKEESWAYARKNWDRLQGCNRALYREVGSYWSGSLKPFIATDREYVLWRLLRGGRFIPESAYYAALVKETEGRYPADAVREFFHIAGTYSSIYPANERYAAFASLAEKYAGKAASVYPRAEMLRIRMDRLQEEEASADAFESLYRDAVALETERAAFKGDEAAVAKGCSYPARLMAELTEESLEIEAGKDSVKVFFQNLPYATLYMREGDRILRSWTLENPTRSFYVKDSTVMALPAIADGDYTFEAVHGSVSAQATYSSYTLSLATRTDSRGTSVYVADYETGVPLTSATLALMKGDTEVAVSSMKLSGFTPLPEAMNRILQEGKAYYRLEARSAHRKSPQQGLGRDYGTSGRDFLRANIYLDRGAYNPGDTVKFKAVVYRGDPSVALKVCEGQKLEIRLHDSEGNVLESQALTTGEFGSAAGQFVLPTGLRGGRFNLEIKDLAYESFRVDEFALPSFDVEFDQQAQPLLPGADVPVSGTLVSYSGHPLQESRLRARITYYGALVQEMELPAGEKFSFTFPAVRSGYYKAEVTVTDASGETLSFSTVRQVSSRLDIRLDVSNAAQADFISREEGRYRNPDWLLTGRELRATLHRVGNGLLSTEPLAYSLQNAAGEVLVSGIASPELSVELPGSGSYLLTAEDKVFRIHCLLPGEAQVPSGLLRGFVPVSPEVKDGYIRARAFSGEGDAYTVVTLYGKDREVLESRPLILKDGRVTDLTFNYKKSYPDAVRLQLFYFIHGQVVRYSWEYKRAKDRYTLPLSFSRFSSSAYPGSLCRVAVKTDPGAELLASVWDKSLDAVAANYWPVVRARDFSVADVDVSATCGYVGGRNDAPIMLKGVPVVYSAVMEAEGENDAVALKRSGDNSALPDDVKIRSEFSPALAFVPQLRPGADGEAVFSFNTSDKLTTYYVRVYAHDKAMHNAVCEQQLVVSLPVKVALLAPRYLYQGDVYEAVVTVSSVAQVPVSGVVALQAGNSVQQLPLTVEPGGTASRSFRVEASAAGQLPLTAVFKADDFSDAVQTLVPVQAAAQQLTEAHSAVLPGGMDREALLEDLRGRFVNVPGASAQLREISVLDMVRRALPEHVTPSGKDVLSLSEALYVALVGESLGAAELGADKNQWLEKIEACHNADGGFAWFEGMDSSPMITAVLLERFASLERKGFDVPIYTDAVEYLDRTHFASGIPLWRGGLSDAQYMYVRSLYADVPFDVTPVSEQEKKRLDSFRKDAKKFLTPSLREGRGLQGLLPAKARRVLILRRLQESEDGAALAKAWGIKFTWRLRRSMRADLVSLREYAVPHRDGGWYYPNAVLPWRGLLESEAYAHALLCEVLSADDNALSAQIADGIRLWLMLQKETQHWDSTPAFVDAIGAVLDGSEAVLNTRVLALEASFEAPLKKIQASGNGFTLERRFFREDGTELLPGDSVQVGDKIRAKYLIWNGENRSFVRLTAGREASLQPVNQLSSNLGYSFFRSADCPEWHFVPQGYRWVKASATEYYFDSYPEEKTVLSEEFYVQRAGSFVAPVAVIESLYAPHYRANAAFRAPLESFIPKP